MAADVTHGSTHSPAGHTPSEARFAELQPFDRHNQQLQENVHPTDWLNPVATSRYNLVVIGGGTAGLVAAAGAAGLGAKVALIERRLLGGDCLVTGCVPSKALLRSARALADARRAPEFGLRAKDVAVDFPAVMERMRRLRSSLSPHDSAQRFRDLGVDVYLGDARFTGRSTLTVAGQTLRFARACIATGGRPTVPEVPGLAACGYLTSESVFSLASLPSRLAIIGGGPIGCELAQAFARFGSRVTILTRDDRLLPRDDPEASSLIAGVLQREEVSIEYGIRLDEVCRAADGKRLLFTRQGHAGELLADQVLVAAGRTPNLDGLHLESAGVQSDPKHGIQVNDFLRTSNRRIYAAGDVCSPLRFTHAADAMARIVLQNALFFGRARFSRLQIPWCTYTDPEVAHVGLHPRDAEARGIAFDTISVPLPKADRAVLDGDETGFMKIHLKKGKDRILGATLVAPHAGELISEITLALTSGLGMKALGRVIHPYPTQAAIFRQAADAWNRRRLTPGIKRLFEKLLWWRR